MTPAEIDRLAQLTPETRGLVQQVIDRLGVLGMDVFVGATRRTLAEVEASRLAGRSSATQTRSWHELGRAADLRPRKADGGPNYDTSPASFPFWRALYREATALGLRSLAYNPDGTVMLLKTVQGARWDPGHVEWRQPYDSLRVALASEPPTTAVV